MRRLPQLFIVVCLLGATFAFAQERYILPAQVRAVRGLAAEQGFTEETLDVEVRAIWGMALEQLTRTQGADLIRRFQSANPPKPSPPRRTTAAAQAQTPAPARVRFQDALAFAGPEPILAQNLVVGMSKRFHLLDGNIIKGTILRIEEDICQIETIDGILRVPSKVILEELASITKRDDTHYVGPVLRETPEEIILRSDYGDVVVSKRDIKVMDRYHGGKLSPWTEEKKTFYKGEAMLTDIFMDPTAFPLAANTFYISGLSLGYGFTERFMVRTSFGNDFQGDLNVHPILRFYHRQTGTREVAAATGVSMFNHHDMASVYSQYAQFIQVRGRNDSSVADLQVPLCDAVDLGKKKFYWEWYLVLSSRRSLPSGRGKVGWHVGLKTNSLALSEPPINPGYKWDAKKFIFPYRAWAAFEYDLSKKLKLMAEMWADNGHMFRTLPEAWDDYTGDDTPFILDSTKGDYRPVDFDFGFLYAMSESFRLGIHFQEPYLIFYWEFYEL